MPKFQTKRDWGSIAPDKGYDLGHVDVRFDVPVGLSWEGMQILAMPTVQKAIDQFEKIGKWRFYDKIPVQYSISTVHSASLARSNMMLRNPKSIFDISTATAQKVGDALGTDVLTMIARVYFIRPLVWVNTDEVAEYQKTITYENGFVPKDDLPAEQMQARKGLTDDVSDDPRPD